MPKTVFRAEVEAKCPFCGAAIAFGTTPEPFATHGFPTCKRFDRMDVIEFLEAVNHDLLKESAAHA